MLDTWIREVLKYVAKEVLMHLCNTYFLTIVNKEYQVPSLLL